MRAGRLDRRITIQRKGGTASASGEPGDDWTTLVNRRPASMSPVRGEERFGDPQVAAHEQVEFRIRWSQDVSGLLPQDRIIYPALSEDSPDDDALTRSTYNVLAVHEIGRREGLQIITERQADVTT